MTEEWRFIDGYDGRYEISNYGQVRSNMYHRGINAKILRPNYNPERGRHYPYVQLSKNNKIKHHYIHRLVATYFIPNPSNKPCINHKDGDPSNNRVDNLEWVTIAENNHHRNHVLGHHPMKGYKFDRNSNSRPVAQYWESEDGYVYLLAVYANSKIATKINGMKGHIRESCKLNPDYIHVGGYIWRYCDREQYIKLRDESLTETKNKIYSLKGKRKNKRKI